MPGLHGAFAPGGVCDLHVNRRPGPALVAGMAPRLWCFRYGGVNGPEAAGPCEAPAVRPLPGGWQGPRELNSHLTGFGDRVPIRWLIPMCCCETKRAALPDLLRGRLLRCRAVLYPEAGPELIHLSSGMLA